MGLPKIKTENERLFTVEEYLELEREAFERSEYIGGRIYQMAGESDAHGIITVNLVAEMRSQLKGTPCQARTKDTKVKSGGFAEPMTSTKGMFSYPDLVVVCGEVEHHDKKKDIILNPKVIFEVLSEATEVFDRNDKFTRYRMFNETLTDYVLIAQDKPMVEHYIRQDDGSWKMFPFIGVEQVCRIESIGCSLSLAELYDRVEFPKETLQFLKDIADLK